MLIGSLQIHIGGKAQLGALFQHRVMCGPRIEPDIQRITHLFVMRGFVTEKVFDRDIEPGVDPCALDAQRHLLDQARRIGMQRAAFTMHQKADRNTPRTLARDAPVGTVFDHAANACLPPVGNPAYAVDFMQRHLAQRLLLHADKPLRCGAEDDRSFVPPAMRVTVADLLHVQQRPALLEYLNDMVVGLEHELAREELRTRQEAAVIADRVVHLQAVVLTDLEILLTMSRCGMYRAGTGLQRHMLANDDRDHALIKGMMKLQTFQHAACAAGNDAGIESAIAFDRCLMQILGQQ